MKAKAILSLYNGEYTFIVPKPSDDERYSRNLSKCISLENQLQKLVTPDIYSLITEALESQNEKSSVEMQLTFINGFPLAVSLLLEAISEK